MINYIVINDDTHEHFGFESLAKAEYFFENLNTANKTIRPAIFRY